MDTKNKITRIFIGVVLITLFVWGVIKLSNAPTPNAKERYLLIDNNKILVEVAKTDKEKTRGLSYRDSLAENTGMLFIYNTPQQYTFWMYEMKFPLDFIWIENQQVADLQETVQPPRLTGNIQQTVAPKVPVSYILEVNAGWIKAHNIKVGNTVTFHNIQ